MTTHPFLVVSYISSSKCVNSLPGLYADAVFLRIKRAREISCIWPRRWWIVAADDKSRAPHSRHVHDKSKIPRIQWLPGPHITHMTRTLKWFCNFHVTIRFLVERMYFGRPFVITCSANLLSVSIPMPLLPVCDAIKSISVKSYARMFD